MSIQGILETFGESHCGCVPLLRVVPLVGGLKGREETCLVVNAWLVPFVGR